jgi:hypothetical protein
MDPLYPILFNTSALLAITGIHFFWLIGGKIGLKYAFPHNSKHRKKIYRPKTIVLFIITGVLALMTFLCLAQTDSFNNILNPEIIIWGNRVTGIIFLFRAIGNFKYLGFTKTFKDTEFAQLDTYIYCPVSLAISLCAFISSFNYY